MINELAKYDFSLEYQNGKNNTMADALSRIEEACLSEEEAKKVLKVVPVIPGDDTIFEVFKEKEDRWPENTAPHTMFSKAMKADLTSGASRRVELEYKADSAAHCKVNSIEVSVQSTRLSTQMGLRLRLGVVSIKGNPSHGLNSWLS